MIMENGNPKLKERKWCYLVRRSCWFHCEDWFQWKNGRRVTAARELNLN